MTQLKIFALISNFPNSDAVAQLIKINEIEGVNFKCIELFIKSNGMYDRVS